MSPQLAREINAADAVGPDLLLCKQLSRRRPLRRRLLLDRGGGEVVVAELSLDDGQRHAFVGDLDGVGVAG